jgi:ketosteroid isomerase-like protein
MSEMFDLVTRFYAAVARGDMEAAAAFIDHDRLMLLEADDLPFGGMYEGIDGFRALFVRMRELWKRAAVDGLSIMASGDTAIARLHLDVVSRKTGLREKLQLVEVCDCDGGKIVKIQPFYFDAARVWSVAGIERPSSP